MALPDPILLIRQVQTMATGLERLASRLPHEIRVELIQRLTREFSLAMLEQLPLSVAGLECPVCKALLAGTARHGMLEEPTRGAVMACPGCQTVLQVGMMLVVEPVLRIMPAEEIAKLSPEAQAEMARTIAEATGSPDASTPSTRM